MGLIRLDTADNVAIAQKALGAGAQVDGLTLTQSVPGGHKVALQPIAAGTPVLKYAQKIGIASTDIAPGDHVHTHNLAFTAVDPSYKFGTNLRPSAAPASRDTFMGYDRGNGRFGTRNFIGILTSVNCSATVARMIADHFSPDRLAEFPNVDGVAAFVHGTGCGMGGDGTGFEALQRVMWGYARHPNLAGVLMVGLGCEMNQIDWLLEAYGLEHGPLFQTMNIQNVAGTRDTVARGIDKVTAMLPLANQVSRTPCDARHLKVALQCGGSDAWSGITANPALGHACDLLAAQGGTGVLAETPEIYGAEHLLTERATDAATGEKLVNLIRWWEDYTAANKGSMDNNPSPGNKAGGLTTILEKSLGAAAKGGTTPLNAVYKYAEPVTASGFTFMDSPGYDPASVTGQIAGGCQIVCFTTGRGSAFGSKPAPTIKIATNSDMARRMAGDMDIDAGRILSEGLDIHAMGREIYDTILATASGTVTKSEALGLGDFEFVPWQIGATM
ncbi:UxaA family hydrolase [Shimia ponticola]|uniref:UxaA family hydrolase n=1 Tax=Shimia ponticola TaxID=2582893 RepID=UPI0011BE1A04|nr:altronate dehydratase family protein [Shimia ponticola]